MKRTTVVAYVEAENRLSVQEVLACCSDYGIESQDAGPCYMGVDQGKDIHVVIGKKHPQKAGQIVHLGVCRDWEELDRLMRNFNITLCIVDALPETRNAWRLLRDLRVKFILIITMFIKKGLTHGMKRSLFFLAIEPSLLTQVTKR